MSDYLRFRSYERLSEEGRSRFDRLAELAVSAFGMEISDVFASEVVQEDGTLLYPSFFLFSNKGITECHDPMGSEHFDLVPLSGRIFGLSVTTRDYDFRRATPRSRLSVTLYLASEGSWRSDFQAAGESCDELYRIVRERLVPGLTSR